MNHYRLVSLLIGLSASIFLYLWICTDGELSSFGLNGFTETLGIGITVLLIDHILQRREEQRTLPQRIAAHADVRLLMAQFLSFWHSTYLISVPGDEPTTAKELLSAPSIGKICSLLDMDSEPNVTPRRTWWEWLPQQLNDFKRKAEIILERHNTILDPKAYGLVHSFATAGLSPEIISSIRQSDLQMGYPRPSVLGSYFFHYEDYFSSALGLIDWCNEEANRIKAISSHEVASVNTDLVAHPTQKNAKCMINQEKLVNQLKAVKAFQSTNK